MNTLRFLAPVTLSSAAIAGPIADSSGQTFCPTGHGHHHHSFHQPIGVMGGHTHDAGGWMLSYRYMRMDMDRNFDGTSEVSDAEVLGDFFVTPTNMTMEMHMFGAMYAVNDRLTVMGMLNLVDMTMDHRARNGRTFTTETSGIGDSSLGIIYALQKSQESSLTAGLSVILPTAEVDEEDITLGAAPVRLPYPMQLGGGSWAVRPSLTYQQRGDLLFWGAQAQATIYLADNDEDYRLGDRAELTGWVGHDFGNGFSATLRLTASAWENIDGEDEELMTEVPMGPFAGTPLVPTAFTNLRGGQRLEASVGLNYAVPNSGATIGLEVGQPIWQDVDGPQLVPAWKGTLGITYTF